MGVLNNWPPGFRFSPTDEELVMYYLRRKICRKRMKMEMICEIDIYKWEPWELPDKSLLQSGDRQWFFFSPIDRRYGSGMRASRATQCGYWKATGKDRQISRSSRTVGVKKTLVFYKGRAPRGERTNWVMHEYTLFENELQNCKSAQECYALYKVFRKSGAGPKNGEQYGAPFNEEEWLDDDHPTNGAIENSSIGGDPLVEDISYGDEFSSYEDNQPASHDWEKFMKGVIDAADTEVIDEFNSIPTVQVDNNFSYETKGNQEAIKNHLVMLSVEEANPPPTLEKAQFKSEEGYTLPGSLLKSYDPSQVHLESPGATSGYGNLALTPLQIGDFLEVNDLSTSALDVHNLQSAGALDAPIDGLEDQDIHQDGTIDGLEDLYNFFDAPIDFHAPSNPADGTIDEPRPNSFSITNQLAHRTQEHHNGENESLESLIIDDLWIDESANGNFTPTLDQAMPSPLSPPPLPVLGPEDTNGILNSGETYNGERYHEVSSQSLWNAAILALLETIPTKPAMATENVLINKALNRISSFRSSHRSNLTTQSEPGSSIGRQSNTNNRVFIFSSILIGLCAILWFLMAGITANFIKSAFGKYAFSSRAPIP